MQKLINGYIVEEIPNDDMADYFERAFNSQALKDIVCSAENIEKGNTYYQTFGNILQAYATSTGDLSDASIEKLAKDFFENKEECYAPYDDTNKMEAIQKYFADYVMPHIVDKHCIKLGLENPLSLKDSMKVQESIYMQCKNNQFLTHSFNGALIDEVSKNGLDVSKEMFLEEFTSFEKIGIRQSFRINKLCFCELSKATFGYAPKSPERVSFVLSAIGQKQKNDQTLYDYFTQSLITNIETKQDLNQDIKKEVLTAGKKMVDFYFKQEKVAIAFMRQEHIVSGPSKSLPSGLSSAFSKLASSLSSDLKNDEEMLKMLSETKEQLKEGSFEKLEEFIDAFNKKYPEKNTLKDFYKNYTAKTTTESCLNHFVRNGNADGYNIDGGKMSSDKFALCVFNNPYGLYAKNEQSKNKRNQFTEILQMVAENNNEDIIINSDKSNNLLIKMEDKDGQVERLLKALKTNIEINRDANNVLEIKLPIELKNNYKDLDYTNMAQNLKFSYMLDEIAKAANLCGADVSKGHHNNFRPSLGVPSHLKNQEYIIRGSGKEKIAEIFKDAKLDIKESNNKDNYILNLPNNPSIEEVKGLRTFLSSTTKDIIPIVQDNSKSLASITR